MKHFFMTAEENVNIQNVNEINKYIIRGMQEIVAHNIKINIFLF